MHTGVSSQPLTFGRAVWVRAWHGHQRISALWVGGWYRPHPDRSDTVGILPTVNLSESSDDWAASPQWHGTKNERAAKILFHNPVCRLFPKTWKLSQTCIDLVTGHFDSTQKCHVCPSSPVDGKSKFRGDESKVSCNLWISVSSDFFQMISNRVC